MMTYSMDVACRECWWCASDSLPVVSLLMSEYCDCSDRGPTLSSVMFPCVTSEYY